MTALRKPISHTPGEWRVLKEPHGISILANDRLLAYWDLCPEVASPIDDEDCANIALMAMAKTLLEQRDALKAALTRLVNAVEAHREKFTTQALIELANAEDNARAALAKAENVEVQ